MRIDDDHPTLRELRTATATDVQWRVAAACNRAIQPYMVSMNRMPRWLGEGRVDFMLVAKLCEQLSQQRLTPADLDRPEGHAAIQAIAEAIMSTDSDPTRIVIHDEVLYEVPTSEWRTVTLAAQHLLHGQPQRYTAERE